MPRNKKEGIIFGISMCVIMVFFMGLLNISIHLGGFNSNSFLTNIKAFPVTFIIAFILETVIITPIRMPILKAVVSESDGKNAKILFNCAIIVTFMSIFMTVIGGVLGGDNLITVLSEFFIRWPRNFCAAFFLNLILAGPISRKILSVVQEKSDFDDAVEA